MPLITVTMLKPKTTEFKTQVIDAVHQALINSGVPHNDKFQRILELDAVDFRFDPSYPDVSTQRNNDFVLIEILLSVGRSVKVKKKIVADIINTLKQANFDPENIMICFKETTWENWSFAGGRFIHV
ncbi:MAG TPA: tautomerase family protein [Gammaproteobacteria bacterium]|nr:tautomerase family protein [Gammaproteobacteria bacterium]